MDFKNKRTSLLLLMLLLIPLISFAHGVDDKTELFLLNNKGIAFGPFLYIGAKHMITGYDHLLFLIGVIFFLYKTKEIITYITYFTIGHSITLLIGVMTSININIFLIDAIIALSIVYKGLDNIGGFKTLTGKQPNTKKAVLIFGLFHGFGLASKLQEFEFDKDGLFINLLGFNLGVEVGQFLALGFILLCISFWRQYESFLKFSKITNILLMAAGFLLLGYQLTGYLTS
ncbi:HupE/UreJ family protein [Tenacibaculum sp. nBUS_03]|uniref:HupE/UreJ family protein n=1 Tax=Tenacibaculum sp. nBUS_03 TaxID=3395320 RepID=UPI003EB868F3